MLCSSLSATGTSAGYSPVGVLWVGPGHIVLQLHVGLFLKALNLWGVIYAWVVWYRGHTHAHTHTRGEDKSLIPVRTAAAVYIPGLKSTMAFR